MRAEAGSHRGGGRRIAAAISAVIAFLGGCATLASLGLPEGPVVGLAAVLEAVVVAGGAAGAYMASAYGWGVGASRLWRGAREEHTLRMGVGLAILLTLSHAIAFAGLLHVWAAVAVLVPGWVLAVGAARRRMRQGAERSLSPWAATWLPGLAVLIVAASSPPGWLWKSEAGGFDALSYHLQLPQEWLASGRMRPAEHNVYSFLPGYLEAAFAHLGAATGAGDAQADPAASGLLAAGGWRIIACQFLHAWMAVLAAWFVRRGVIAACRAGEATERDARGFERAGWIAGALVLCTPWTIVTGSLAYNDMAVVALGAASLVAAMEQELSGARRGALCAVLVGAACGVKPTAILMVAPPTAAALFVLVPRREWGRMCLAGILVGSAMLAPWMVRNALANGNPVFPHLAAMFGAGHWTLEQVERYEAGHFFAGGAVERVRLLVAPAWDGEGSRGITHPQWGVWSLVMVLGATALAARANRRLASVLAAGMGFQVVVWMSATHLQSRFLTPTLAWGGVLAGIAIARLRGGFVLGALAAATQAIFSVVIFAQQGRVMQGEVEGPNARVLHGVPGMTGVAYREALENMSASERAEVMRDAADTVMVNLELAKGELLYLLGDSTPLYYRRPVLYHTTWDESPLGAAMRAKPGGPMEWTGALRARGVRYVLIYRAELARLQRDGWYDPMVTVEAVDAWARGAGAVIRTWPPNAAEPTKVLIDLRP